ncbi:6426_t:CDS:2 [Diversispora eburnea]|uniref:6426_t:CDS:1 n=1 Tax=Diversispora eburnea TaxID=1213867 RepID=A0A9N8VTL6_9GLOM|nr:6426_t:CDS:2 [Diversispora eburnea]
MKIFGNIEQRWKNDDFRDDWNTEKSALESIKASYNFQRATTTKSLRIPYHYSAEYKTIISSGIVCKKGLITMYLKIKTGEN